MTIAATPTEFAPLDRDALAAALDDADLRVLLMCLFHVTGDQRWLGRPFQPARDVRLIADEEAGLADGITDEIRPAAVDLFTVESPIRPAITDPGDELMVEMMRWCMNDRIADDYATMFREDLGLTDRPSDGTARDPPTSTGTSSSSVPARAASSSASVSWTWACRSRSSSAADEVGGTWRDNIYPGAAVDTPNHAYSFSTGSRYRWSRNFSPQPELFDYLRQKADEYGIRDHIRFESEVTSAAVGRRRVPLARLAPHDRDDHQQRRRRPATRSSSTNRVGDRPVRHPVKLPDVQGADTFDGPIFHTTEWPADLDLTGKRVAIIGTGASAMQIVPTIADTVGHLTIVQRTPAMGAPDPSIPRPDLRRRPVAARQRAVLRRMVPLHDAVALRRRPPPPPHKDPEWPHPERSLNRVNESHRQEMVDHIPSRTRRPAGPDRRLHPRLPALRQAHPARQRVVRNAADAPNVSLVTGGVTARSPRPDRRHRARASRASTPT